MSKYALLFGLNYIGTSSQLYGCINDVSNLKDFLIHSLNYSESDIQILTDNHSSNQYPTKDNMLAALDQFVEHIIDNNVTTAFLSYSGHGTYIQDTSGDERDHRDEALVPLDYKTNGFIKDDVIQQYLKRLPETCSVFCIFDCCHSGTMCDLKYSYDYRSAVKGIVKKRVFRRVKKRYRQRYRKRYRVNKKWKYKWAYRWRTRRIRKKITIWKQKPRNEDWKRISENKDINLNCNLCALSGCRDSQTSADAYYAERGSWAGALTHSFLTLVQTKSIHTLTCKNLLIELNRIMKQEKFIQRPNLHLNKNLTEDQSLDTFLK